MCRASIHPPSEIHPPKNGRGKEERTMIIAKIFYYFVFVFSFSSLSLSSCHCRRRRRRRREEGKEERMSLVDHIYDETLSS